MTSSAPSSLKVRVTGRVQGVFFRGWTRDRANDLGVRGWVRNCDDGSVEARLEGDEDSVASLVDHMRRGPPSAEVQNVEIEESEASGFDKFEVRR